MAQRSGLFDSTEIVQSVNGYPQGNRAETADFFAQYFANFISNGVFANPSTNFKVMAQSGLTVVVRPGSCFINGYMAFDTAEETHTLTASGEAQDWYFVQRMYLPDGTITKTWVLDNTGTAVPVRTATTYDLVIALVRIPAGASVITDSMITDYRYDDNKCGIVHATVDHIDTTELATQLNAAAQEFITAAENSLTTWQGTFDQWFNAVKGQLSTDAAGALENKKAARAYAVCDTAAATAAKTAILDGYYLAVGQPVNVKFTNAAGAGATLNINGTGAIPIYKDGAAIGAEDIRAGMVASLVYNGTAYELKNPNIVSGAITAGNFATINVLGKLLSSGFNADSFTPKNQNLLQLINGVVRTLGGETIELGAKIEAGTYVGTNYSSRTLQLSITPKILVVATTIGSSNLYKSPSLMVLINNGGFVIYYDCDGDYFDKHSLFIGIFNNNNGVTMGENYAAWSGDNASTINISTGEFSTETNYYDLYKVFQNNSSILYNYVAIG